MPVGRQQRRDAQVHDLLEGVLAHGGRDTGVEPVDGLAQAKRQQRLPVIGALGCWSIVCDVRAVAMGVADIGQPAQRLLF